MTKRSSSKPRAELPAMAEFLIWFICDGMVLVVALLLKELYDMVGWNPNDEVVHAKEKEKEE